MCQTALNALKTPQTIYISMANNLFCNENIRQKERTPKEDARTLKYLYQSKTSINYFTILVVFMLPSFIF